jgi:hypothetical protein
MKKGHLSDYFTGVAAKRLSVVEADQNRSHQHEFNGSGELVSLFGTAGQAKHRYPIHFLYLDDEADKALVDQSEVTWYDARAKSAERTGRSEHRLYFPANEVTRQAKAGDLLLIARRQNGSLLGVIAEGQSTISEQLHWLFGLSDLTHPGFAFRAETEFGKDRLGVVASLILEQIGIEPDLSDDNYLEAMLTRFGSAFPPTRVFSEYARSTLRDADPGTDPDAALTAWMDREEILFRTLEKHLISERLRAGFLRNHDPDVDTFLSFSLSVQNRRKSRAGAALENHLECVLAAVGVHFDRGAVTERHNKPDFVFPSAAAYHDARFPSDRLTVLGAKTTAKDRWRQITKEADRIALKHLLTLEPAISVKQTDQMRESQVQLVVPATIHGKYTADQCKWLLSLRMFIDLLRTRQKG